MGSDRVLLPPNRLYSNYIETGEHWEIVERLWNRVPVNLAEAQRLASKLRIDFGETPDIIEDLKKAMKRQLRNWGVLTSRVEENIDRIERGVIEAGQQPMCLGGPGYILNKVACTWKVCDIGDPEKFVPLYYVADYDGIHNELLNIRIPSPSPKGLLVSFPVEEGLVGSPIFELPNPPEAWLRKTVEKIRSNYRGLLRGVEQRVLESKLQNLDRALTILRTSYFSSEKVSEWSTKILGSLFNVEADLGVPILAFSMPDTRRIFQSGYELLLSEPTRSRFIEASNGAVEIIYGAGYRPQIGLRADDYVPFFLECMNKTCRRMRIELKYRSEPGTTKAHVVGKCPSCGEEYDLSFEMHHPDLSEVAEWISPRVDSRQMIVNSVIPVLCHVGGPGETSYYAEVIPAARSLKVPFPTYIRYTRTFYNTPWNERYAEGLEKEGQPTLLNEDLFSALRRWVEARNAQDPNELAAAHSDIRRSIESTYYKLLERNRERDREISAIKERLGSPENRQAAIKELQSKMRLSKAISLYLSSAFGRFSPERFGQEVNWSWLDLATVSGVDDLFGVFLRQYNEHTPISSMFFVNL